MIGITNMGDNETTDNVVEQLISTEHNASSTPTTSSYSLNISTGVGSDSEGLGLTYTLPAIRSYQGQSVYYTATCPMRVVHHLFGNPAKEQNSGELPPPQKRVQRSLSMSRVNKLRDYLTDNPKNYTLAPLTASLYNLPSSDSQPQAQEAEAEGENTSDGGFHFKALAETGPNRDIGHLILGERTKIELHDGQHRVAAIIAALQMKKNWLLMGDYITVIFYLGSSTEVSQQRFVDLNSYAVKPPRSINLLFDQRDHLSVFSRWVAQQAFRGQIELEKTNLASKTLKLFTLNALYHSNAALLGGTASANRQLVEDNATYEKEYAEHQKYLERTVRGYRQRMTAEKQYRLYSELRYAADAHREASPYPRTLAQVVAYWKAVYKQFPDWAEVAPGGRMTVAPSELRERYVHAHGVFLQALGHVGHSLIECYGQEGYQECLEKLAEIDWRRSNPEWEGRLMVQGRMSASNINVLLTSAFIKKKLGLPLDQPEINADVALYNSRLSTAANTATSSPTYVVGQGWK